MILLLYVICTRERDDGNCETDCPSCTAWRNNTWACGARRERKNVACGRVVGVGGDWNVFNRFTRRFARRVACYNYTHTRCTTYIVLFECSSQSFRFVSGYYCILACAVIDRIGRLCNDVLKVLQTTGQILHATSHRLQYSRLPPQSITTSRPLRVIYAIVHTTTRISVIYICFEIYCAYYVCFLNAGRAFDRGSPTLPLLP